VSAAHAGLVARAARGLLRLSLGRLFRLRLVGEPPGQGPYLLIANHQGWADPFVLIALLPAEPRIHFLGDRTAVRSHWWKRLAIAAVGGLVLIDRTVPVDRAAISDALGVLEGGGVLALFPEGRVSRREADLGPFERGSGWLAFRAHAPVVPIWLRGTAELYLGRELVVTLGTARVPPDGPATKAAIDAFTEQLHADVAAVARPWTEPVEASKRWRWLTDIL